MYANCATLIKLFETRFLLLGGSLKSTEPVGIN